jgi:transcriptional regulator with XRE-family HTH domain
MVGDFMALTQRIRSKRLQRHKATNEYVQYRVGETLRKIRLSNNMTQTFVAHENGLSSGMISLIESNNISASIRTLSKLINFYGLKMSCLFEDKSENQKYEVIKKNERRIVEKIQAQNGKGTGYLCESLAFANNDKRVEPFIFTLSDDLVVEKAFTHDGESFIYVLQGNLEIFVEDHMVELKEGDSMYLDASLEHRFHTKYGSLVTVLLVKRAVA